MHMNPNWKSRFKWFSIPFISVYFLGFLIYYPIACIFNVSGHGLGRGLYLLYYPLIMLVEKLLTK